MTDAIAATNQYTDVHCTQLYTQSLGYTTGQHTHTVMTTHSYTGTWSVSHIMNTQDSNYSPVDIVASRPVDMIIAPT